MWSGTPPRGSTLDILSIFSRLALDFAPDKVSITNTFVDFEFFICVCQKKVLLLHSQKFAEFRNACYLCDK